ncbi:uncharacterized protein TrAFT101_003882 [Trichoderma asperellum]|uniref:uncharacterized protein n=1 Tax=Trichoderma asperellum TaxID=101201 RepID=UPI00333357A1|nr:hypothetical protein TrAFT101_003882 [Trichoderma asperellum]
MHFNSIMSLYTRATRSFYFIFTLVPVYLSLFLSVSTFICFLLSLPICLSHSPLFFPLPPPFFSRRAQVDGAAAPPTFWTASPRRYGYALYEMKVTTPLWVSHHSYRIKSL